MLNLISVGPSNQRGGAVIQCQTFWGFVLDNAYRLRLH